MDHGNGRPETPTSGPVARPMSGAVGPGQGEPLKIGIVSPYGYPHPGGVNSHIRHTSEAMRRMGHHVSIITSAYGREREDDEHVFRLGVGFAFPTNGSIGRVTVGLRFIDQSRELLARERFDILHFHEPFVPFLSPIVLRQSRTVNIGTFHAFAGFSPSYEFGSRLLGRYARRLHGRIAVSGAARHLISRYFPGEYRIIPNGVDLELFRDAQPIEDLRDGTLNILFVGRLEERKGLVHLLRAYHRLKKRHVDARLIVIGAGPQRGEYRRLVAAGGMRDVEFVGAVSDDQKARYFASSDIFCAPSTGQESFGLVLLEAMAAGLPIVASDIHGYKNVVQRNVQGLLVEPRNHRALAAALYRLSQDPELRQRMGAAGLAHVPEYSWDRVTERTVAYYREVRARVLGAAAKPRMGRGTRVVAAARRLVRR